MEVRNKKKEEKISFTVSTIDCIACAPVFKRELQKLTGVKNVEPLPMMNVINVESDSSRISSEELKEKILEIASKAGYSGRVIFR